MSVLQITAIELEVNGSIPAGTTQFFRVVCPVVNLAVTDDPTKITRNTRVRSRAQPSQLCEMNSLSVGGQVNLKLFGLL